MSPNRTSRDKNQAYHEPPPSGTATSPGPDSFALHEIVSRDQFESRFLHSRHEKQYPRAAARLACRRCLLRFCVDPYLGFRSKRLVRGVLGRQGPRSAGRALLMLGVVLLGAVML